MKVAIVHDDLMQWGGAERVLLGLCEIFPQAPIFTSIVDFENENIKKNFSDKKIITSFLQKIPFRKYLYKKLLPLYPFVFEQFNFDEFDVVISQTTRFAKSIITKPETFHICYCHTPPRFLWHFSGIKSSGFLETLMTKLRIYDQISSRRVDRFIAGSKNAKQRIKKIYKSDAMVIYPFVDLRRFENVETFNGEYFVVIGRLNKYKRFDLAIKACEELNLELKIIDGNLNDDLVVKILSGSRGLIMPGEEDFGLASLEAQALGKGVIAFKNGGAKETIIDNETGVLFEEQTTGSLKQAINKFLNLKIDIEKCKKNASLFNWEKFKLQFEQTVATL